MPKRKAHKRKPRRKRRRSVGQNVTKSRTHTDYNRNKVNISVGKIRRRATIAKKANELKEMIYSEIGKQEIKKLKATTRRSFNNARKHISRLKSQLNRIF